MRFSIQQLLRISQIIFIKLLQVIIIGALSTILTLFVPISMSQEVNLQEYGPLSDTQARIVNKINFNEKDKSDCIQQLVKIELQDGDDRTYSKIFYRLTQSNQIKLQYAAKYYDYQMAYKQMIIQRQFKRLKFHKLSDEERYYIIKIIYERKKENYERYIDEVLDMMERPTTKSLAKRIYKHLPEQTIWRFDKRAAVRMAERQRRGQKLQKREFTCKDRFLQCLTFLGNAICKKKK